MSGRDAFCSSAEVDAATKIQALSRGFLGRLALKKKREAVGIVQRALLAQAAREKVAIRRRVVLPYSLYLAAQSYLTQPEKLDKVPNPTHGNKRREIYMPPEAPLVIRRGEVQVRRHRKMTAALDICLKHNLTHFMIPRALCHTHFLIEERVPAEHCNSIAGMWYYYSHRELFATAVAHFTTFLCCCGLQDLIVGFGAVLNGLTGAKLPKFDNILVFQTEEGCKIAAVDLETFASPSQYCFRVAASDAIQLFPYHTELIIDTVSALQKEAKESPFSTSDLMRFRESAQKSLELYEIVVGRNLTFYERHKITPENPSIVQLSAEREKEVIEKLGSAFKEIKGFQEALAPFLIEEAHALLSSLKTAPCSNYGALILQRSLVQTVTLDLQLKIKKFCIEKKMDPNDSAQIAKLPEALLKELIRGGELSFYKKGVSCGNDVIFY